MSDPHAGRAQVGVSELYADDGENWLRVSPGHAVSERWLQERAPDLYAEWWAAPSAASRDQVAQQIEGRVDELEAQPSWREAIAGAGRAGDHDLEQRIIRYENAAERLAALGLNDPARPSAHMRFQQEGDELRAVLSNTETGAPSAGARRLEAAELVADRPVIETVSSYRVQFDSLAAALVAGERREAAAAAASADAVRAAMVAENPHAALQADVLTAVTAAGHDLGELREDVRRRGVDLARAAPAVLPASEFYERHVAAIDARLDREIAAGGFRDLPSYMATWGHTRPVSGSLHDTEHAVVAHMVEVVLVESDDAQLHDAERMWQRAADRAALQEWSVGIDRGDLELTVDDGIGREDRQLELGLAGDASHEPDVRSDDLEREVG